MLRPETALLKGLIGLLSASLLEKNAPLKRHCNGTMLSLKTIIPNYSVRVMGQDEVGNTCESTSPGSAACNSSQ